MAPIPAEYHFDFWNQVSSDCPIVELTCLLPNGILILLKERYNATLEEIKENLWEEAARYPLFGKLHDISVYIFKIINSMAEEEELTDETRKLCDIRPIGGVLIITECKGGSVDHTINVTIGQLIGKGLQDFDALNSSEINDFRFKMRKLGNDISLKRNQGTAQEKLWYQFPPRFAEFNSVFIEIITDRRTIDIETMFLDNTKIPSESELRQTAMRFSIEHGTKPSELIRTVLSKHLRDFKHEDADFYILKVKGRDEYLVGDYHPIIRFQYIQDCICENVIPSLIVVHFDQILDLGEEYGYIDPLDSRKTRTTSYSSGSTLRKRKIPKSSWDIIDNFVITMCNASKLNCDAKKSTEVGIKVGLFHGNKPLCQPLRTEEKPVSENNGFEALFDESLEFDIKVCNIPRSAKICFVVYELNKYYKGTKPRKGKDDNQINPIAWANTSVYDFKGQLRTGSMTLYLWSYTEDMGSEYVLHPLGTVVSNPNTEYATALTLLFKSYEEDQIFEYPCVETMIEYAIALEEAETKINIASLSLQTRQGYSRLIHETENVNDLHDQDRKALWRYRRLLMCDAPEAFPKLLFCIDWDKREDVSLVMRMLHEWPKLPVEKALELLDYAYADQEVRSFAVHCLMIMSDDDVLLYLLQLVQAIKHELYLECDLVNFLIQRALFNQKIGHFLFWHLRSEMQISSVSVRFGLILEAYCRGTQEHIPVLLRQLKSMEKFKQASEMVRKRKDREKAKAALKECLMNCEEKESVRSLLDPSFRCSKIKFNKCRIMDSKMRPLWIVYENADSIGDDIYIIFKNGDDLRQDMLTLQMIKVMDRLWKREGLDLRMNPYNCISLEEKVGMIEVVLHAETIANIQKENNFTPTAAFRRGPILSWLKYYNPTESSLNKAIQEFTMSCAGYCVATYVLGIADRHSDNIMVKKNGQLFHIDFGHILGHFKEKFGIRRERVPFVLTHDFVHVINKGQRTQGTVLEFKIFQDYCERAFMILRKHGSLILSLFAMMISTGLPELSSEKDLQYLRETLVLSKHDKDALAHFRAKFDEALSNSWKTSLNWASHNMSKNNKA